MILFLGLSIPDAPWCWNNLDTFAPIMTQLMGILGGCGSHLVDLRRSRPEFQDLAVEMTQLWKPLPIKRKWKWWSTYSRWSIYGDICLNSFDDFKWSMVTLVYVQIDALKQFHDFLHPEIYATWQRTRALGSPSPLGFLKSWGIPKSRLFQSVSII